MFGCGIGGAFPLRSWKGGYHAGDARTTKGGNVWNQKPNPLAPMTKYFKIYLFVSGIGYQPAGCFRFEVFDNTA
jgi:hypothetical protein